MNRSVLEIVLGVVESGAGFILLWATMRITSSAGFSTSQRRWALFRRFVYGSQSVALFGLGLAHLETYMLLDEIKIVFQFTIMFGVVVFPLLRAFNLITQDQFKSVDGSSMRQSGRSTT